MYQIGYVDVIHSRLAWENYIPLLPNVPFMERWAKISILNRKFENNRRTAQLSIDDISKCLLQIRIKLPLGGTVKHFPDI